MSFEFHHRYFSIQGRHETKEPWQATWTNNEIVKCDNGKFWYNKNWIDTKEGSYTEEYRVWIVQQNS